ncbi:hypothetical protein Mapa_007590 [Marchantia paleacea]|nr:hypothetical protein Mapa_007590 [Marchantia paleacea]
MSGKKLILEVRFDNQMTQGTSSRARHSEMAVMKTGGAGFDIVKYDGRGDYFLWERQVKGKLKASGLGKSLKPKPFIFHDEDWKDLQEQAIWSCQIGHYGCCFVTSSAAFVLPDW